MFPFKKILCPTDFSEPSLCGLKMGGEMARQFDSEIILVNVHKPIPKLPSPRVEASETTFDISVYEKHILEDAEENLTRIAKETLGEGVVPRLIVRVGSPAEEILDVAEEENVDAIIIATHGRTGLAKIVFGSVAQRVVRRATCPVLTIRTCL
ncbi:MAG: universal stress protein [Gemmatimonadales bacterium]|nr:universal stress protein [Gemmatimonadales bacterium]